MPGISGHNMFFLDNTLESFLFHDGRYLILGDRVAHLFQFRVDPGTAISSSTFEKDIPDYPGKPCFFFLSFGRFMVQPSVICTPANF